MADIGSELGVSRARVQQIEKKIIRQLIRVIFEGIVFSRNHRVDDSFAEMWKNVATNFQDLNEISVLKFINEFLVSWGVCLDDIEENFNFISVIFTGKVRSHLVSQYSTLIPTIVSLREKFGTDNEEKLSNLRLKKGTKFFAELGIFTIGDFLRDEDHSYGSYSEKLIQVLDGLELSIKTSIDWPSYIGRSNFEIIGREKYETGEDFLADLHEVVLRTLELSDLGPHCKEVFMFRTSKHPKHRPTLMEAADKILGKPAHGPVISGIQTHFLEYIRHIYVDKDYSHANFWIAQGFVDQMDSAREIYELAMGNFEKFVYLIQLRWGVKNVNPDSVSVLWTLIDGYTPLRYFHLTVDEIKKRRDSQKRDVLPTIVRLSGFRDIY
jgi:hypothetical protein